MVADDGQKSASQNLDGAAPATVGKGRPRDLTLDALFPGPLEAAGGPALVAVESANIRPQSIEEQTLQR